MSTSPINATMDQRPRTRIDNPEVSRPECLTATTTPQVRRPFHSPVNCISSGAAPAAPRLLASSLKSEKIYSPIIPGFTTGLAAPRGHLRPRACLKHLSVSGLPCSVAHIPMSEPRRDWAGFQCADLSAGQELVRQVPRALYEWEGQGQE